jgi:uncharacterized coiled-coil protein SlyX
VIPEQLVALLQLLADLRIQIAQQSGVIEALQERLAAQASDEPNQ